MIKKRRGGVAYRVGEIDADGAIIVSPLPLQEGAQKVAAAENIKHIKLTDWSTATNYLAEFMGTAYHGISESAEIGMGETLEISVIDKARK